MEKITTNDTFNEDTMCNVTKLIKNSYDQGTPLNKDLIESFNINEYSIINIIYKDKELGQNHMEHNEPLGINIISKLPLHYYKDYMKFDWLYCGKKYSHDFIGHALGIHAYDTVDRFLELGFEYLNEYYKQPHSTDERNYSDPRGDYLRFVLQPILTVHNHLRGLQYYYKNPHINVGGKKYEDVFYKALQQYADISNEQRRQFNSSKNFNPKKWFIEYDDISSTYNKKEEEQKAIIESALKHPEAFVLFKDICEQLKHNNKVISHKNIQIAFDAGNEMVVDYINKHLKLDKSAFQKIFLNSYEQLSKRIDSCYGNYGSSDFNKLSNAGKNLIKIGKKYLQDLSFLPVSDAAKLLLTSNSHKKFIESFATLSSDNIIDNLNLKECLYAREIFTSFMSHNEFKLKSSGYGNPYPNYQIHLLDKLKELFPQEDYSELDNSIKLRIHDYISENLLKDINLEQYNRNKRQSNSEDEMKYKTVENLQKGFNIYILNHTLEKKDSVTLRHKL